MKSSTAAALIGLICGAVLFALFQLAGSSFAKEPIHKPVTSVLDHSQILLARSDHAYNRAPLGVSLATEEASRLIPKTANVQNSVQIVTSIDIELQTKLQRDLLTVSAKTQHNYIAAIIARSPARPELIALASTTPHQPLPKELKAYLAANSRIVRHITIDNQILTGAIQSTQHTTSEIYVWQIQPDGSLVHAKDAQSALSEHNIANYY